MCIRDRAGAWASVAPRTSSAASPGGLGARGAALLLMENAFVIDGVRGDNRDVLLAWQGFAPTALDVLGLAFDNPVSYTHLDVYKRQVLNSSCYRRL